MNYLQCVLERKILFISLLIATGFLACKDGNNTGGTSCGSTDLEVDGMPYHVETNFATGSRLLANPEVKVLDLTFNSSDSSFILIQIYDYANNNSDCFVPDVYYSFGSPNVDCQNPNVNACKAVSVTYTSPDGTTVYSSISQPNTSLNVTKCGNGKISGDFSAEVVSGNDSKVIAGTFSNICYTFVN
jgi:hypothetical protein